MVRRWVPVAALAFAVLAAVSDPGGWARLLILLVPLAAFIAWDRVPSLPIPIVLIAVLVPVVVVQLPGRLEPAMFLVSLFGLVVARRVDDPWQASLACGLAVFTPVVLVLLQPADDRIDWPIWMIGIAFPAVIGRVMHRQEQLNEQLHAARLQLAGQARAEERRRIARDVHDLVGHGLTAVLVQVASARHVLRRDVEAADEALRSAQDAGRRSMADLRATVELLRSPGDDAATAALPDFARLSELVEFARSAGMMVDYRSTGDIEEVPPNVGVALYRIAQEALHNAVRHAPAADVRVSVTVTDTAVALEVDSLGAESRPSDPNRSHFGIIGMRERAAMIGAELEAGATPGGWRVRCLVPVRTA
ncbi:MAG: integral rane sensor signal transduction histidine kinase [Frankiales bacterium]|nr:integral rane sensor signal transduction histidine kinase [Frankiales bacterium]